MGRTPLAIALLSPRPGKYGLIDLLAAGASLAVHETDFKSFGPHKNNLYAVFAGIRSKLLSCFDKNVIDVVTTLVASHFENNGSSHLKWNILQNFVYENCVYEIDSNLHTDIFMFFNNIVRNVCSKLNIEFKLFHKTPRGYDIFREIFSKGRIQEMKYFITQGISMDDTSSEQFNYFDYVIESGSLDAVWFMLSIGARPKKYNAAIFNKDSILEPSMRALLKQKCSNPPSLKNICRLKVNESLNVDRVENLCPRTLFQFLKLKR